MKVRTSTPRLMDVQTMPTDPSRVAVTEDVPSGDAGALYESLFEGVLKLDPALKVYPAHEYKGRSHSTIGQELAENPRLQKRDRAALPPICKPLDSTSKRLSPPSKTKRPSLGSGLNRDQSGH